MTLVPQLGVDRPPDMVKPLPGAMHGVRRTGMPSTTLLELVLEGCNVCRLRNYRDLGPHLAIFFNAVRSRQPVAEDVVFGHHAAAACHMANASYFENKVILKNA